jgi:RHS repeat-associated protein
VQTVRVQGNAALRGAAVGLRVFATDDAARWSGPLELTLDYSSFRDAFGGNYGSRLRVAQYPACVLSTPDVPACQAYAFVPSTNDSNAHRVTVPLVGDGSLEVAPVATPSRPSVRVDAAPDMSPSNTRRLASGAVPAAAPSRGSSAPLIDQSSLDARATSSPMAAAPVDGGSVYVLLAAANGPLGNYSATTLASTANWQVGLGSGAFTWSYPIQVPPPAFGPAPALSIDYDSQGVDGLTGSANVQPSTVGQGWSVSDNYIERSYAACSRTSLGVGDDLCWGSGALTLSLNGQTGELVGGPTNYRLVRDPGWRISRFTGRTINAAKDGEYFAVTTTDGTVYYFGWGRDDYGSLGATRAVYTAPVWTDGPGQPCASGALCFGLGWRFNLDRVVDKRGAQITYYYAPATNYFRAHNGRIYSYVNGGQLENIYYGSRSSASEASYPPTDHIGFVWVYRCVGGTQNPPSPCPAPGAASASQYPDVPLDKLCTATSCAATGPTFFTVTRLAKIATDTGTLVPGQPGTVRWTAVQDFPITSGYYSPPDRHAPQLLLAAIDHRGHYLGEGAYANVNFGYTSFEGRADAVSQDMYRLTQVNDEFGGRITTTYAQPNPCTVPLANSATNLTDCYPLWTSVPGGSGSGFAWYRKWVVSSTTVTDRSGLSPAQVTRYAYALTKGGVGTFSALGSTAVGTQRTFWHYADARDPVPGTVTWSEWRGYPTVMTTSVGDAEAPTSSSVYVIATGLNGDHTLAGPRANAIQTGTGAEGIVADPNYEAGQVLARYDIDTSGVVVRSARNAYFSARTSASAYGPMHDAWIVRPSAQTSGVPFASGSGLSARSITTTYDPTYGLPTTVQDETRTTIGSVRTTDSETCTSKTYAGGRPPLWTQGIVDRLAAVAVREGPCGATATAWLSNVNTYYDGSTSLTGGLPPVGDATKTVTWGGAIGAGTPACDTSCEVTLAGYDSVGRLVNSTDAAGGTTRYEYVDAAGATSTPTFPTYAQVTSPLGDRTRTTTDRSFGQTLAVTDELNATTTTMAYDPMGRLARVWLADEPTGAPPSQTFAYDVEPSRPIRVTSRVLVDPAGAGTYLASAAYSDGLLRPVQRQTQSPTPGHAILTGSRYGVRGQVVSTIPVTDVTGSPGGYLGYADAAVPSQTRVVSDLFLRPVATQLYSFGVRRWTTTTAYDGVRETTVSPPTPDATAHGSTRTTLDAGGRVIARVEDSGGTAVTTSYVHDALGRVTRITDSGDDHGVRHSSTRTYDMAGRVVASTDPDAGTTTTTYDVAHRRTTVTDQLGDSVVTTDDADGRPLTVTSGADTLVANDYNDAGDTAVVTNGFGRLNTSTTTDPAGQAYTVTATGYDPVGRQTGTKWTFPTSLLTKALEVTTQYDRAGRVQRTTYPATGSLPAESVTQDYDATTGLATTLSGEGTSTYVTATTYDGIGQLASRTSSDGTSSSLTTRAYGYDPATLMVDRVTTTVGGTARQDEAYAYDAVGNLLSIQPGNGLQTATSPAQCYGFDRVNRLTEAWTNATTACDRASPNPDTGYDLKYRYQPDGNLDSASWLDATGLVQPARSYTYDTVAPSHPHEAVGVGTAGQVFDADGQLTQSNVSGTQTYYAWNALHQLSSAGSTPGSHQTTYAYDAEGNRLARITPGRATLYIAGEELTVSGGSVSNPMRYYSSGDALVALRTPDALTWLLNDKQGSSQIAVTRSGATVTTTRAYYTPYGELRGGTTPKAVLGTDRGFLGKANDPATGLDQLGARSYDPGVGQFISPDPLVVTDTGASVNPYTYASDNPVTSSDPSGLEPISWCNDSDCYVAAEARRNPSAENHHDVEPPPEESGTDDTTVDATGQCNYEVQGCTQNQRDDWVHSGAADSVGWDANDQLLHDVLFGSTEGCVDGSVASCALAVADWAPVVGLVAKAARGEAAAMAVVQGLRDSSVLAQVGQVLASGLTEVGADDAAVALRGSAVTGRKFGPPYTRFRESSDLDLAIASPSLLRKALEKGVDLRSSGSRTGPLTREEVEDLGLLPTVERASRFSGHPLTIMIYDSLDSVQARGTAWVRLPTS